MFIGKGNFQPICICAQGKGGRGLSLVLFVCLHFWHCTIEPPRKRTFSSICKHFDLIMPN